MRSDDEHRQYLASEREREASSLWRQAFSLILQQTGDAIQAGQVANGAVSEFRKLFGAD